MLDTGKRYPRVIMFTQYLRPDGRKVAVEIDRPDPVVNRAEELIGAGFRFEVEHLTTGHASLTIHDPKIGEDVAIRVVTNDTAVPAAVDNMVIEFHAKWKKGNK